MSYSNHQITLPDYSRVRVFNKKNEEAVIVETYFKNYSGHIKIFSNGKDFEFEIPLTHIETTIACGDEVFEFRYEDLFESFPILYKELVPGTKVSLLLLDKETEIQKTDHIIVRNGKVTVFYKTKNGVFSENDFMD